MKPIQLRKQDTSMSGACNYHGGIRFSSCDMRSVILERVNLHLKSARFSAITELRVIVQRRELRSINAITKLTSWHL